MAGTIITCTKKEKKKKRDACYMLLALTLTITETERFALRQLSSASGEAASNIASTGGNMSVW